MRKTYFSPSKRVACTFHDDRRITVSHDGQLVWPAGYADVNVQDDGNVVIYEDGEAIWNTATFIGSAPPPPTLHPIEIGNWQGQAFYPAGGLDFFPPALAAIPQAMRLQHLEACRARGDRHYLVNAWQSDWGPDRGRPEWTGGGVYGYDRPDHITQVLVEIRQHGMTPILGLLDRRDPGSQTWIRGEEAHALSLMRQAMGHWGSHIGGVWPIWEVDEEGDSTWREDFCKRMLQEVDWQGKDVFIHTAAPRKGGFGFYGELGRLYPGHVVRAEQYPNDWTISGADGSGDPTELAPSTRTLVASTRLLVEVALQTDTKLCAAEHSAWNVTPTWTPEQSRERAVACLRAMARLAPEARGSLNGW